MTTFSNDYDDDNAGIDDIHDDEEVPKLEEPEIGTQIPATNGKAKSKNKNKKQQSETREKENDKPKLREIRVFKYSQMGKGDLHESIIINALPFFLRYNHELQEPELLESIPESSRILRPPHLEEYPYLPYEFESSEELRLYLQRAREINKDQLYKIVKSIFSKYVDHDNHVIVLLAADSMWTYSQDLYATTHYIEGVGTNDVGKSSIGYTFEYTGYRVVRGIGISGANYIRILGNVEPGQCTIVEDEGDSISEDPDKIRILKAGYEYNGKAPRINMNTVDQDSKWYKAYCLKIILAEKSLREYKAKGLVDRTFSIYGRPGKPKFRIKEVVIDNPNRHPGLQRLYQQLVSFRKLMLCFRLVHYKDQISEINTGLINRDNELCKPLLQFFYGTETLKEIVGALEIFVKQRRARRSNSLESALYSIIKRYVFEQAKLDYTKNTFEELKTTEKKVLVPFWQIWEHVKAGYDIPGTYEEKKNKYAYETEDYGPLYLNSLSTFICDKFTAQVKKQSYGIALLFNIEKLETFEAMYGTSQLDEDVVKIQVTERKSDDYDDYDDYDDFLDMRSNFNDIVENGSDNAHRGIFAHSKDSDSEKEDDNNNKQHTPQKVVKSSESSPLNVDTKEKDEGEPPPLPPAQPTVKGYQMSENSEIREGEFLW